MSTRNYMFRTERKPVYGARDYSRKWACATAVTAGTVEDE